MCHIYLFYNYASVYLGLFCVCVCVVNWQIFLFWRLAFSLYTYQIIQHPHQRLKLQLTDFPLVLPSHVDSSRRGDGEHSWFVLLLVQHYKVVHTSSTRNGINLRTDGDRRELLLMAGGLRNTKINNTPPPSHNICVALDHLSKRSISRNKFPDHFPCRLKVSFSKTKMRDPSGYHGIEFTVDDMQTCLRGFILRN